MLVCLVVTPCKLVRKYHYCLHLRDCCGNVFLQVHTELQPCKSKTTSAQLSVSYPTHGGSLKVLVGRKTASCPDNKRLQPEASEGISFSSRRMRAVIRHQTHV